MVDAGRDENILEGKPEPTGDKVMSKYEPLRQHLHEMINTVWHANFVDIEEILGFSLPPSAREHQAWWSNDASGSRQSRIWLEEGWRTEQLDLSAERIVFRRTKVA